MKISDLIALKPIQSIIQLDQRNDSEIVESFIWTDELSSWFNDFLQRLNQNQGGGIFLKGHYGMGKSHILSFLTRQALENWKKFHEKYPGCHIPKYIPISISLVQWSASSSLESIIENSIQISGDHERQIKFENYIQKIQTDGYFGLIILLDELSEFLKSKSDSHALSEDLRYLQFLSEFGKKHAVWTIGAIQEDIEGFGQASRATSLKLKDRFPIRWNLSLLHSEELISQRLLIHRDAFSEKVSKVFSFYKKIWPKSFNNISTFSKAYPVHPGCMDFLGGLGKLFSEHRGVLMFVKDILDGSWKNEKRGHLEYSVDSLITTDLVFDYFQPRISENLELKDYEKAYLHLEARCAELIKDEHFELALKCVKIVILASLDPRREGIHLNELCEQLLIHIGNDKSLGEELIYHHILEPLIGRCNYIAKNKGRYVIDLRLQVYEFLERFIEQQEKTVDIEHSQVWEKLTLFMNRNPLNFCYLSGYNGHLEGIHWQNTLRTVSFTMGRSEESIELQILYPYEKPHDEGNTIFWVPRKPNEDELKPLKHMAALLQFLQTTPDTVVEKQTHEEAQKQKSLEYQNCREILESMYKDGHWVLNGKALNLNLNWNVLHHIEEGLEEALYELYQFKHPLFHKIAPKLPFYNECTLTDLIQIVIRPGMVSESDLKKNKCLDAVHGILEPMGLVQKNKNKYNFVWDSNKSIVVQKLESLCEICQGQLPELKSALKNGPLGLTSNLTEFLIWASIASGYFNAKRDGEVLDERKISFHNISSLEELYKAECLSDQLLQSLLASDFFSKIEQSGVGLALQRQLWTHFCTRIEETRKNLNILKNDLDDCEENFKLIYDHCEALVSPFEKTPFESNSNSLNGLESLFKEVPKLKALNDAMHWIKDFKDFYPRTKEAIKKNLRLLKDEYFGNLVNLDNWREILLEKDQCLIQLKQFDKDELFSSFMDQWLPRVKRWYEVYCGQYQKSHDQFSSKGISEDELLFIKKVKETGAPISIDENCQRDLETELAQKPFCRCGFTPPLLSSNHQQLKPFKNIVKRILGIIPNPEIQKNFTQAIEQQEFNTAIKIWSDFLFENETNVSRKISKQQIQRRWYGKLWSKDQLKEDVDRLFEETGSSVIEFEL